MTQSRVYVGWIPTALGNLSFKVVGHNHDPFPTIAGVFEDTRSRVLKVFCVQRRTVPDYAFLHPIMWPRRARYAMDAFLARWRHGQEAQQLYIFIGSAKFVPRRGSYQVLVGEIWCFRSAPRPTHPKKINAIRSWRCHKILKELYLSMARCVQLGKWQKKFFKSHRVDSSCAKVMEAFF